ncbi:MAG: fructose-1,6-bisphosphatase [Exilispira sp.]|nr:fructose-1,6-bisphosphatase [Exilispira sp.]
MNKEDRYFSLLKKQFPSIDSAITEIINLEAIRNLPKGTEHFISDIHGEYRAFDHILRTASGVIKKKVEETFNQKLSKEEKDEISILISYPEEKLELIKDKVNDSYLIEKLEQLLSVCRVVTSKYTRSKVRKALPNDFGYVIEELLHEMEGNLNKKAYHNSIIRTIIRKKEGERFIISIAKFIQKMVVDRIHILGDIFDRGPGADIILDNLIKYQNVDFVWGNHDILWLGAACGNLACIANCIRISLRYANHEMLREGYGIDISPLASLAYEKYFDCANPIFEPKISKDEISTKEFKLMTAMHKAITVIQLKLEAQIIKRNPDFAMQDRSILNGIDFENGVYFKDFNKNEKQKIEVKEEIRSKINEKEGCKSYKLLDSIFPTINPNNPFELDEDEEFVMKNLSVSFLNSEKLQKHANFLMEKGRMYLIYNGNLLFHGCIPLDENGDFSSFIFEKERYSGKALLDYFERKVRTAFYSRNMNNQIINNAKKFNQLDEIETNLTKDGNLFSNDIFWFLWCGKDSPLFGKNKMATFERYFIEDKETHEEPKNHYYFYRDKVEIAEKILNEFSIEDGIIVNGHVPVKVKKGESPIKAEGKLLVIDGGMAKAYQKETGIAGYTLIYSSNHLLLAQHSPLIDEKNIVKNNLDLVPNLISIKEFKNPVLIKDTDIGKELQMQILALEDLIEYYKKTARL